MERGKWIWKKVWLSICSKHQNHDPTCDLCQAGFWQNKLRLKFSSWVYKKSPRLWIWWVNR